MATEAGWSTNLAPVADVYVQDGSYATSNFNSDAFLTVKLSTLGFTRESFLRFALPAWPGSLADARLQLQPISVSAPGTHAVAWVTNDTWSETALTWNTKPASGAPLATWVPLAGVPVQVSIVGAVQQELSGDGVISLRLFATNSTSNGRVDYASKEAGPALAPSLLLFSTNGPALSVTQSFWVTVTAPVRPLLSSAYYTNGALQLKVSGDTGPDYLVQSSTNLSAWTTILTNNAPGNLLLPSPTNGPAAFYRVVLGP